MAHRIPTYRDRVQKVLCEVARGLSDDIAYEALVDKVHLAFIHDDVLYGPRSKDHIRGAVGVEVRARRVVLRGQEVVWTVVLTANGKHFYREMGGSVILAPESKRLMGMTIPQLCEQTTLLRWAVLEIKHIFAHFSPNGETPDSTELPDAVNQLFHRIDNLNHQWTDIQQDLTANLVAMRALRAGHQPYD